MSIRDVEGHCGECGHEVIERRYDAHPFHSLTLPRLRRLLDAAPDGFAGTCPQCDAAVSEEHAVRWVLHYGFASGRGLIQGFGEGDERRWLLSPHDAFDVQLVPAWDRSVDQSRREVEVLDAAAIRSAFGREFNAKEAARTWLADRVPSDDGAVRAMGPALRVVHVPTGGRPLPAAEVADPDRWAAAPLVEDGLPVAGYPGAADEWLAGLTLHGDAWGLVHLDAIGAFARSIPEGFPIQIAFDEPEPDRLVLRLPDREERGVDPELDARGIAVEAARALLDPGDATRLEIDRLLLALTGMWSNDAPIDDPA